RDQSPFAVGIWNVGCGGHCCLGCAWHQRRSALSHRIAPVEPRYHICRRDQCGCRNSVRIARNILAFSHETVPIAVYHVNRVPQYGLEFYLDRPAQSYDKGDIPAAAHVLVAAQSTQVEVAQLIPGRRVSYLTSVPAQKLDLYWVGK